MVSSVVGGATIRYDDLYFRVLRDAGINVSDDVDGGLLLVSRLQEFRLCLLPVLVVRVQTPAGEQHHPGHRSVDDHL